MPRKKADVEVAGTQDDEKIIVDESKKKDRRRAASAAYYNIPEDELQEIIERAKAGSSRDQAKLLQVFNNFVLKYTSLLYRSKYDLHDYDIRLFISLFIPDPEVRRRLRRNQINHKTYKAVNDTMRGIHYMISRYCEEDDVKQTVQMTFLHCVNKYKRKGSIPFSGFIYSYFYFVLKKNVDTFLIYQLGRKSFPLYTDDGVSSAFTDENISHSTIIPETESLEDIIMGSINVDFDEYWVLGETAMFPFDELTVQQRQLVKWRFIDGLKASQIALKTTEHPNTCRAQIQEIRDEIKNILAKEFTI